MTAATPVRATARPRRASEWRRAWVRARRRTSSAENRLAIALVLFSVTLAALVSEFPSRVPFSGLALPVVLGSIFLGPRTLPWFVLFDMLVLTFCVSQQESYSSRNIGAAVVLYTISLVVLVTGFRRTRLGVAGLRGETMFVDLRDRILDQGHIPNLPAGWAVESVLHSAGGTAFAGDFVVATKSPDGRRIQVVVVDVSGKGEEAGTRALLLAGAFGGLLGALPAEGFLPAANEFLVRQDWDEGFATAVHLALDLETGDFEVRTAGHPPAVRRGADEQWDILRTEGPLLGLFDGAEFGVARGRLETDDALVLYTDGMVEVPGRDIDTGIDLLVSQAGRLLADGRPAPAERLARILGSKDDDRAVLLVRRS